MPKRASVASPTAPGNPRRALATFADRWRPRYTPAVLETFKRMWLWWQGVAQGILWAQNAAIMTIAYFVGVGPVALGFKLTGHKLLDRAPPATGTATFWVARSGQPQTMDEAARQF